jgi:hypothetical protein
VLTSYQQQTQNLLHDVTGTLYSLTSLTGYINTARSQAALEGECVRFLAGWDGLQLTGTFSAGLPSVTGITYPAGFADTINNWVMVAPVTVTPGTTVSTFNQGAGTITMAANANTSGTFAFTVGPPNITAVLQEMYPIPLGVVGGVGTALCASTGINGIIGVKSISLNWGGSGGSNAYMLDYWDWSSFQAYLRFYGQVGLQGNPAVWTRYQNNIYIRPVPTTGYPMQWDAICNVIPLTTDSTPEAIPYPFTDAVQYYAAYLALLGAQRPADAMGMKAQYTEYLARARAFWQRTIIPTMYPNTSYR